MTQAEKQFLYLFRCHLNNEKLPDGYHFDIGRVFCLAQMHNVLPAIYDVASESAEDVSFSRLSAVRLYGNQVAKNSAFRILYSQLQANGFDVIVLKGPVCAFCYDKPDYRLSSDFDIVIDDEQKDRLYDFLMSKGFYKKNDALFNPDSGLYIEVDTCLSEGEGIIKEMVAVAFEGFRDRCVVIDSFRTLGYTDFLVYLVYHAFKHFIGSGFGVRQIADIGLFIKKYKNEIDSDRVSEMISVMGIKSFYENILVCCNNYFLSESVAQIDENADYICKDEFVEDLISAGVFGKSSEDRLHSANLVLNAVNNKNSTGMLNTIFPSYKIMKNKYVILEKFPILLPFFWFVRLINYFVKSLDSKKDVSPVKSIEIANCRIDLMKKMGIIEQ